ncbi:MAG: GNAT family N-acetyltransferase [Roseibium sp.]|nr:GNAT family N-acetyltransferase [Roseibium sp.]
MTPTARLETNRFVIRPWREDDLDAAAEICADPEVMRYFPAVMSRMETTHFINRAMEKHRKDGFCFSPVIDKTDGEFLGFVGLSRPTYKAPLPFDPCVEIGWRLKRSAWGKGVASEAARAWLRFGFETLKLSEIVSFTARQNMPSQKVMKRIGMTRDRDGDFEHPALDLGDDLSWHVLYRLTSADWRAADSRETSVFLSPSG